MSVATFSAPGTLPATLFDYEILERLGKGAHSMIYAAAHPASKQLCAVKHVWIGGEKELRYYEQLENELAVGQYVNHRTVRQSLEIKTKHDRAGGELSEALLVMEFFDGVALDQWESGPAAAAKPGRRMLSVFVKTAEALGRMHAAGLVHCDIKPANILTNESGEVRLIDLGQACRIGTVKKRLQGTPDFIAPEQARLEAMSPWTDVYNFGATMYRMLAGKTLPTVVSPDGRMVDPVPAPTPQALNPRVGSRLSKLVMECVRARPEQRPRDMATVVSRLEELRTTD